MYLIESLYSINLPNSGISVSACSRNAPDTLIKYLYITYEIVTIPIIYSPVITKIRKPIINIKIENERKVNPEKIPIKASITEDNNGSLSFPLFQKIIDKNIKITPIIKAKYKPSTSAIKQLFVTI